MASRSQAPRFGSLLAVLGLAGFTSLVAPPAQATIAIGAPVSAGRRCTNVTPGTTNVVTTPALTPAGANRLLVVGVSINRNNSPAAVVGGVTFGGLPLTQLGQATEPTNNDRRVELWYLVNPAAGAFPVITTINGLTATNTGVVVGAISFSEVDTAAPFGAVATATGVNQAGSTLNVASLAGDAVIDTVAVGGNRTVSLPGGSGQTQRWNLNSTNNNSGTDVTGFGSTEPATAAATTMSETFSGNSDWAQIGVAVKPAPADLAITKTDSVDPIAVSQNTTYTITVTNNGPGGATNVAMTDPLPAGMGYVSATPSQGSCSGTSTVTCDLGTIASGGSATVSIVVTGAVTGTHSNTATVAATETDPNSANNSATETTTVTPLTDLAIVKSGPALAYLGDAVSYTLTASNGGPSPAMNVTVTDVLPAGTVFWSAIPSQGSCSGTTTVVCTLGSIASGAGATVTITVQVMVLGVLSNTATVAGSEPDPNLADNSSTLLTTVAQIATADLAISKSGNPASVAIGANVTYTVVVVNNGPDTAPGVTVTDPVPAGMTLVSANSTLGTCSGTLIVTCNLGSMANGAVATITMVATVGSAGTKSNTATVALDTATAYDPNPVNDTATATTAVSGGTAPLCSVPGSIGPGGTLSGVINTYYPGTASVAPGGTSITLGAARGATTPVGIGDLLLVIQMQDAQINSTNTDCYGAGVACQNLINGTGPGAGAIPGTVNAGKYEFVRATNAVPLLGGTLNLQGVGAGNGLVNGYTDTNATAAKGQSRFQVVRGLEFTSATLSSATPVTAAAWTTDASGRGTGGVLALDVAGTLTMGAGLIATVDGLGFRGAAGRQLAGEGGTCSVPAVTPNGQDWRGPTGTGSADPCDTHGGKGEGNAGTPLWVYNPSGVHTCGSGTYPNIVNTNQPNDGYPNGSMARGAPGNAGGGSTDPNPASNDQNSGGGGGSNGGAGGTGGRSWFSNLDRGGRGAAVTPSFSQLVLGGGGGAGTRNNDNCGSNGATAADEGQASSGAAGGGLMLLRAASFAITAGALVTANGADAYDETKNDGGGGGGAGGSVVLTVTSGTMGGLSVQAIGGNGGSAWKTADGTTNPGNRHGPGGGGGGGVVAYTNTAVAPSLDVTGGQPGVTTTANDTFGAQAGDLGQTLYVAPGQIPGVGSAADCSPDPAIALTHAPATVPTGATVTFLATVTNAGPFIATSGPITVTITIDPGLTPTAASGSGWNCGIAGQTVTCTRSDALVAHQSYAGISIGATAIAAGPTLLTGNTATVGGGGDINTANNTATDAVGITAPTLAVLRSFQAVRFGDAVVLNWQTSFESRNLGFRVHREVGGVRLPITPALIAGSALFVGQLEMRSGRSYSWVDKDARGDGAVYWLEDIDLNGTRQWTGPAVPVVGDKKGSPVNSPLLRGLGRAGSGSIVTASPGLGARRRPLPPQSSEPKPWTVPSGPAAKILVGQEGWYRVTKAELMAAGFNPGTDPQTLRLLASGWEEAILVLHGDDGSFDDGDAIEFYGVGFDSPYDATRTYWLVAGQDPGMRIKSGSWDSLPPAPTSFPFTVERKDRTIFFAALTTNGEAENFFGPVVAGEAMTQELTVSHLDPSATGISTLRVALQGVTAGVLHQVDVSVNGQIAGSLTFFGQERAVEVLTVPNAWLIEGNNQVGLLATGGEADVSLIDFVRLTYPRAYRLDSEALRMTAPPNTQVTLRGLADSSLRVVDVSDPAQVRELPVRFLGDGPRPPASVSILGADPATLLAFTSARVLPPNAIQANAASSLRDDANRADLLVIAHPTLLAGVEPLRALRQAQGLLTQVVDVTDVYDEFAFGQESPLAIRDFLWHTQKAWARPPRYVLLVGDASFDPKEYLGMGNFDLVPSKLVPTAVMKTDSDDWFVDFAGDSLPDLAIGRLPARTPAELSTMVAKILTREAALAQHPDWARSVLLVADQNDGFDFESASAGLRTLLPRGFRAPQVRVGQLAGASRDAIVSAINAGQLLVSYTGHGSEAVWSQSAVFDGSDALALTNGAKLPVLVAMTCLNGLFDDLYVESLAEAMLKAPGGGAAAVWASSGLTEPEPQAVMNQEFFRWVFQGGPITLGDAIIRAKAAVPDQDTRRVWILFGDPTMRLH